MIRAVLTLPALFLLGGALVGCAGAGAIQSGPGGPGGSRLLKDRKPAPAVQGTTLDGKRLGLGDFTGKVVVVNFWASGCAPCRAEAPTMEKVYEENKASRVEFLGVDIKDGKDNARAFARTFKIAYPSLYDQAGRIPLSFRDLLPNAVPSTLVVDRQGRIAARVIGSVPYTSLKDLVTRLSAES